MMRTINPKGMTCLLIVSIMTMTMPGQMLADESAANIEKIKQLRQLQNQSTTLKKLKAKSVATKATPEQERMLRLSNVRTKAKQQKFPDLESHPILNLNRTDRSVPQVQTRGLRDVFYGSGQMSRVADSLYFNFLSGMMGNDTVYMDVMISSNEGTNFGSEPAWIDGGAYPAFTNPSLIHYYSEYGSLDTVSVVPSVDDPLAEWATISWAGQGGNNGQSLAIGNLWVIHTRISNMYVVMEVTGVNEGGADNWFTFDYMIQTDGSNVFYGTPSLYDMTVNDLYADTLMIGANPYFEITLDGNPGGEFVVFWDANHDGDLDDDDVFLEFHSFMDNDMNDEDLTSGVFGFTYSDEMADGLNYLADDLIFAAFSDMDMAVTAVHFYTIPSPYSVSGSIYETNAGGAPIEGIVVWAVYDGEDDDDQDVIIAVTDGAGHYHIDLPETGNVTVSTEDTFYRTEGLIPDPSQLFVNVQGPEIGYNFYYVVPTSSIEGYVFDESGTPIRGVEVKVNGDGGPGGWDVTGPSGYYGIGVLPGEYSVSIDFESLPAPYVIPHAEYVAVGDFSVSIVNFTLHTANNSILGVVTLDGVYFEGASVGAMNELGFTYTHSTENGYFELPVHGESAILYDLTGWIPDMSNIVQVSDNHNVPAGAEGVEIVLETVNGGIFGYFIDSEVNLPIMNSNEIGMMMREIETGIEFYEGPDNNGYYEIQVPPGLYEVLAWGMDWMGPEPDTIVVGQALTIYNFYMTHFSLDASLNGYVFNQEGMPIPYAQVQIGNESWGTVVITDELGYYDINLPSGFYQLSAWAEGFHLSYDELAIGPGPNNLNFFLEQFQIDGAITGEVYDFDTGAPIVNAHVYVEGMAEDSFWSTTDEDGEFWFDLPNGFYDIEVEHLEYPSRRIDQLIVSNDTTYLSFDMELPDGGCFGLVYDDLNDPIQGAEVFLLSVPDSGASFTYSDDNGYFSIPAANGEYLVFARAPGFEETYYGNIIINSDWVDIQIFLQPRDFAAAPEINFIVDQPDDQGRWVRMQFWPGGTEWGSFSGYSIWRLSNTPWGPILDFVEYLPNHDAELYNLVLPTLVDSSAMVSDPIDFLSAFVVTGHWDTYGYIDGVPSAGYSVDNIHPGIPGPLALLGASEESVEIGWEMSMDDDFQYFEVYRAINPDFTDANVYATTEPVFSDGDVTIGQTYYYAVSAVDANGNVSDPTNVVTTSIVSVHDAEMIPTAYGLSQNYPNPFNPTTSIEFALPEASEISLEIYNLLGQKVRTLVNGYVPAGYINTSWDGLDQNGKEISSGTYIYRLQTADQTFSKKMVLMK